MTFSHRFFDVSLILHSNLVKTEEFWEKLRDFDKHESVQGVKKFWYNELINMFRQWVVLVFLHLTWFIRSEL